MKQLIAQVTRDDFDIPKSNFDPGSLDNILQIVFGLAGGIAMVVLVLAGFKYVVSRGDPAAVAKAKNTIIYAIVGLVITIAAFSIVTFVVKNT